MGSALEIETAAGRRQLSRDELEHRARAGRIPVDELLADDPGVTHVTFESADGDYRASIPLSVVRGTGVVVLEEDGSLRLRVGEGQTLCWNVKDLARIRPTADKEPDSVPADPPH